MTAQTQQPKSQRASLQADENDPDEKPEPSIFAIMLNGHDVIRGAMTELDAAAYKGDIENFKKQWQDFNRWQTIHQRMEEGNESFCYLGLFGCLDMYRNNVAKKNGLRDHHKELEQLEQKVESAIKGKDMMAIRVAYYEYEKLNREHLLEEEKVMMPEIMAIKETEGQETLRELMVEDILPVATREEPDGGEFFVKYAIFMLERHSKGKPRARVFIHALFAVSSPEEWEIRSKWCQDSLSERKVDAIGKLLEIWDVSEGVA